MRFFCPLVLNFSVCVLLRSFFFIVKYLKIYAKTTAKLIIIINTVNYVLNRGLREEFDIAKLEISCAKVRQWYISKFANNLH
jgi:hypothetical protein